MRINSQSFGTAPDGSAATLWSIENSSGLSLSLTDWGASIVSVKQPDRDGKAEAVVLGFEDASAYLNVEGYLGATCGRFANRIAGGEFTLDGNKHELFCNDSANHLHGGGIGFNARIWEASPYSEGEKTGIVFSLLSQDGDEGYPGEMKITADYALDEDNRLTMEFIAETDAPTVVNITNHAYWNLAGIRSGTILDQTLELNCSSYLPVDAGAIPTGERAAVADGPFDFTRRKTIGRDIDSVPGGYDHCLLVDGDKEELRPAATATDPASGRKIVLHTDRPGIQFYSGNFLTGRPFPPRSGFCLEPQDLPDAPNQPTFPSTVLRPGETYHHRSMVVFSTE